jgi:hypothetical protein
MVPGGFPFKFVSGCAADTNLKGTHPGTIPVMFGLIWFRGFRGEDLNVIFYQDMPNLHNRYKSAEKKISHKNLKIPCPPSKMATVTKNRNFFKWPKLLYFKPECAQILTV